MTVSLKAGTLKRLHPLSLIDKQYFDLLIKDAKVTQFSRGEVILKKQRDAKICHYLLTGAIEARESFDSRARVEAGEAKSWQALEELLGGKGVIKALRDCSVLSLPNELIDRLLNWSSSSDIHIAHLEDGETSVDSNILIDDNFEEGWEDVFFQSPLARHLKPQDIQELFKLLEDKEVKEGEEVVKKNTEGDFFYIIKRGAAEIFTDKHSAFSGKRFELRTGNYFGDEALVADGLRNATVAMTTDGVLGRLSREDFNRIVKESLIHRLSEDQIASNDEVNSQYIDVRLPAEYRFGHRESSLNIPISHLRKKIHELDPNSRYFVTPEGGARSELATYLLTQAGFEAYCLAPASS